MPRFELTPPCVLGLLKSNARAPPASSGMNSRQQPIPRLASALLGERLSVSSQDRTLRCCLFLIRWGCPRIGRGQDGEARLTRSKSVHSPQVTTNKLPSSWQ